MNTMKCATVLIFSLVSAGLISGCAQSDAGASESTAPHRQAVQVQSVVRGPMTVLHGGTATLEAERAATVVAQTAGEVIDVLVEEGDSVRQGQVLARLDGRRARLSLAQQQATQRRLSHESERHQMLKDRNMVSKEIVERARFDHVAQTAQTELAALEVARSEIRAPFDGTITRRHVRPGQMLATNTAVFDIADFSSLEARLSVPESSLAAIAKGQAATLHADAFPNQQFVAAVDRIAAVVDGRTGTAQVTLDVVESGSSLRPGQLVRIVITTQHLDDAVLLPRAAVLMDREPAVFVVENGIAHRRDVRLGVSQGDLVQALSGIDAGSEVVIIGQSQISDNDAVEVVQGLDAQTPAVVMNAPN